MWSVDVFRLSRAFLPEENRELDIDCERSSDEATSTTPLIRSILPVEGSIPQSLSGKRSR